MSKLRYRRFVCCAAAAISLRGFGDMNNPPHLILLDNRVCCSPATASSFLAAKSSYSSSLRFPASFLSATFNQRSRKVIHHGEGRFCKHTLCGLRNTGHGSQARHGKYAKRHGKPSTSLGLKKRMKAYKEAETEERLSKRDSSQPSEDCVSRLFEDQPFRLHNSTPTFRGISQEWDMPMQEPPSLPRRYFFTRSNETSQVSYFGGNPDLKPDFSMKLLKILSGFKEEGERDDVKSTEVGEPQFGEETPPEVNLKGFPQSEVFTSSELQIIDVEKQAKTLGETPDFGKELVLNKSEPDRCAMSNFSGEDIMYSSRTKEDDASLFDSLFLEETDFSSESSGEECEREENMEEIYKPGIALSNSATTSFQGQKTLQSESSSPPYSKQKIFVSPRHLSRSSGSRSSPSRSSIPGLCSKYSKPDPKAKQLPKFAKPLCFLPKFEANTEGSDKYSENGDAFTSNALTGVLEGEEKELDFDWWESDEDDIVKNDACDGVKLVNRHETGRTTEIPLNSGVDINVQNNSISDSICGISNGFENSSNQAVKKPECIDFEWSDSEEEMDMRAGDSQLSEWSDSESDFVLNKKRDSFGQSVSNTRDSNSKGNSLVSAVSQHLVSSQKENGAKSISVRPLSWYDREVCEKCGSITYVDSKLLHQLPATVKFLEVPPWASQEFSHLPFAFQHSYSEAPKSPILGFRDHYSPFGPKTMERPWTGRALTKPRRLLKANQSYDPMILRNKSFEFCFNRKGVPLKKVKSGKEVLGHPLTDGEVKRLVQDCHVEKRQVNLGRDGLTHNMLCLIHTHWKKRPVCRIKCRGAPTLDMDNVCFHVEDKTGGQIIYRTGCMLYVFRGRHYRYRDRLMLPLMLYRPSSPVYPKLVPQAPAGLTIEEAHQLRILGQKVKPLIKLRRNGAFPDLVRLVRDAFMVDELVSLDYDDLRAADYRKIGAKLRELVPCVLLSFRNHRIVLWKGKDLSPSSPDSSNSHVEETTLVIDESCVELIHAESSSINTPEFKLPGISIEARTVHAADVGIQKMEEAVSPFQSNEDNIEIQPRGSTTLIESSVLEQHTQIEIEAQGAARDLVVQQDVLENRPMNRKLDDAWEMALTDGVAIELEGVHLDADLVLHVTSVFSQVAPIGPEYTNNLINKLRLQGVYEKPSKRFFVNFPLRRESLPKWRRERKRASLSTKVKRRPDVGYPVDALARILQK